MRRRARRVTIALAAFGAAVVAVLSLAHWGTVRDHVEVWCFQLTRRTRVIEADELSTSSSLDEAVLHQVANLSHRPVIYAPEEISLPLAGRTVLLTRRRVKGLLEANGWRVLEQRFPRRAWVVLRDENAAQPHTVWKIPSPQHR